MGMHRKSIKVAGVGIKNAEKVLLLLHGRGSTAEDIISFAGNLHTNATHIIAPQARNNTWYPYGFMSPVIHNEPWLTSAITLLEDIMTDIQNAGIQTQQVFLIGFSQGACLCLEFAGRNGKQYGGIVAFTGGLMGEVLDTKNYQGDFDETKIFIGNSDNDPHVPLHRSEESKKILEGLGANVTLKIYKGMGHTINEDEINWVNQNILFRK